MAREAQSEQIQRQIKLPFGEAVRISFQSLKIRFGRSIITTSGILLGIAFFVSVMVNSQVTMTMKEAMGQDAIDVFASEQETTEGVSAQEIWLVTMSLIVCVVGIANAMLMAVTERFREIGTMKCLGALDRFVVELFLLESGFQGLAGAVVGALLGTLFTVLFNLKNYGLDLFWNFPLWQTLAIIGVACIIGMLLAVIGAAGPAYQAAKMPPAEAMRVEV
ncbi:TPA: FtsX-like permease family protein [Candidatus Poribacteria bacterium]|nr:FtsX-like permease family protein [Candidatus Poribacteria bacterium]